MSDKTPKVELEKVQYFEKALRDLHTRLDKTEAAVALIARHLDCALPKRGRPENVEKVIRVLALKKLEH